MLRVFPFLLLGLCLPSVVSAWLIDSLDLMIVIDDSSRLRDRGGKDGTINTIISNLFSHLKKEARDSRIGLVTYNDKNILPYIECQYTKNNYCSRLRLKLQNWADPEDFLREVSAITYGGAATDRESVTDMYAGIMTALGHNNAEWREQSLSDPVYRAVFVVAGALSREGGQKPYGGIPDRFPNTGVFYADCANQDYYTTNQVISTLRLNAVSLHIVSYGMYIDQMSYIVNYYRHAFTASILKPPDWIAKDFVSKLVFYRAAPEEASVGPMKSAPPDVKRRVLEDPSDATGTSDASDFPEPRKTLPSNDLQDAQTTDGDESTSRDVGTT